MNEVETVEHELAANPANVFLTKTELRALARALLDLDDDADVERAGRARRAA